MEEKWYWVWYSLLENNEIKKKLLNIYKSPQIIFELNKRKLLSIEGIGIKNVEKILDINKRKCVNYHLDYMKKNNIDIIGFYDEKYPKLLKKIENSPTSLYVIGNKDILNYFSIAIIGCRESTLYGEKVAQEFAFNLSNQNIVIVSGLAKGIDSFAHKGCLRAKNKTIAVLGNGLDIIYPKCNLDLAKEILRNNGTLISEYPLGTKVERKNFLERNRIISGLSNGILVVEAKEKSGTLSTVDFALEQGKDVFVVPGNIDSDNSVGTNQLIMQGANVVCKYKDILVNYEIKEFK